MRKQVGSSRKVDPLLVKEADFLRFFSKLSPTERKKLIHKLTSPQIRCLSEIFSNFLKQNLTRNPAIIKRLKRYKDSIRAVALKKTSLLKKKNILSSKTGGSILSLLLPIAGTLISSLVR